MNVRPQVKKCLRTLLVKQTNIDKESIYSLSLKSRLSCLFKLSDPIMISCPTQAHLSICLSLAQLSVPQLGLSSCPRLSCPCLSCPGTGILHFITGLVSEAGGVSLKIGSWGYTPSTPWAQVCVEMNLNLSSNVFHGQSPPALMPQTS